MRKIVTLIMTVSLRYYLSLGSYDNMRRRRAFLLRCLAGFIMLPMALTAQTSMKAIVIHQNGGPEVLKYEDVPRPQPKGDEILIRVMAAAVNPVDVAIREGRFGVGGGFPFIPG